MKLWISSCLNTCLDAQTQKPFAEHFEVWAAPSPSWSNWTQLFPEDFVSPWNMLCCLFLLLLLPTSVGLGYMLADRRGFHYCIQSCFSSSPKPPAFWSHRTMPPWSTQNDFLNAWEKSHKLKFTFTNSTPKSVSPISFQISVNGTTFHSVVLAENHVVFLDFYLSLILYIKF